MIASILRRLRKARGYYFHVSDIGEEMAPHDKRKIEENIAFILRREKMMPEGASVIVPEGAYGYNLERHVDGPFMYYFDGDWELFARGGQDIIASGEMLARGIGLPPGRKRWGPEIEPTVELQEVEVQVIEVA